MSLLLVLLLLRRWSKCSVTVICAVDAFVVAVADAFTAVVDVFVVIVGLGVVFVIVLETMVKTTWLPGEQ